MILDVLKMSIIIVSGNVVFDYIEKFNNNIKRNNLQNSNNPDSNNPDSNNPINSYNKQDTPFSSVSYVGRQPIDINSNYVRNRLIQRDSSVVSDPLVAPERRLEKDKYGEYPLIINERTRGDPDSYQMVGLLYSGENDNKNYQLFGRRTYPGSNEWEYYIRGKDNGGLDIKFPLNNKQEIYDGTSLLNPLDNKTYNIKIYDYDKPRYIPFV